MGLDGILLQLVVMMWVIVMWLITIRVWIITWIILIWISQMIWSTTLGWGRWRWLIRIPIIPVGMILRSPLILVGVTLARSIPLPSIGLTLCHRVIVHIILWWRVWHSLIPIVPNIPGWERSLTQSGTWLGMWGIVCSELGMIRWREISWLESNPSVVCSELGMTRWGGDIQIGIQPRCCSPSLDMLRVISSLGQWCDRWVNSGVLRWGQMRTTHLGDGIRWLWVMWVKCVNCTRLRYTWGWITMPWGTTIPYRHIMPRWVYWVMGRCWTWGIVWACVSPTWMGMFSDRSLSTARDLWGMIMGFRQGWVPTRGAGPGAMISYQGLDVMVKGPTLCDIVAFSIVGVIWWKLAISHSVTQGQWRRGLVPVMGLFPPWRWVTIVIATWGVPFNVVGCPSLGA